VLLGIQTSTAHSLGHGKSLVGIDKDLEVGTDGLAHGDDPLDVVNHVLLANLRKSV
jgi:hypothetical protein